MKEHDGLQKNHVIFFGQPVELGCFFSLGAQRFFTDNMLAVFQKSFAVLIMHHVGAGNVDSIDAIGSGHCPDISEDFGGSMLFRIFPASLRSTRIDGSEFPQAAVLCTVNIFVGDPTGADCAKSQHTILLFAYGVM